ncbi:MAG TPA: hypothetical protein ENI85_06085 [Deltaproteobacteria bacterium]|nr:hypothetical protein [Deltaproteobacteria bacterium]
MWHRHFRSLFPGFVACLLLAAPAASADRLGRVDGIRSNRPPEPAAFDLPIEGAGGADESRFLSALFDLVDEAALLNEKVGRWLLEGGREGLDPRDYFEELDRLRSRIEALPVPGRLEPVRQPILEALLFQRGFVRDWFRAIDAGLSFESQLTDEFAYHEGLHRSHRMLLKAHAELLALFPEIDGTNQRAFQDHLDAMDFR